MTPEDFVEWLDQRIADNRKRADNVTKTAAARRTYIELASQLEEVKQMLFTLTTPPTTLS